LDEDGLLTGRHRLGVANQITLAQEVEDPFFDAAALVNLGIVHVLEGHAAEGIAAFQRGLEVTTGIGSTYLAVSSLDGLAAALEEKHPAKAARLFAASDALRARTGVPRSTGELALYQPCIDALQGELTREEEAEVSQQVQDLTDAVIFAETWRMKVRTRLH
jgi:hypothetical protein